jgi:hypothetical protein
MKKWRKALAAFLLAVFSVVALPAPVLHELFANHTDVADNHCRYYHKDLGRHIEEQQTHCDIFKANTPLYDAVTVSQEFTFYTTVITYYKAAQPAALSLSAPLHLPARAPPAA